MLKAELFLRWEKAELAQVLENLTRGAAAPGLLTLKDDRVSINPAHSRTLQLLAAGARETLQRYAITFWLLSANPSMNRSTLEKRAVRWRNVCRCCTVSTHRSSSIRRSSVRWY